MLYWPLGAICPLLPFWVRTITGNAGSATSSVDYHFGSLEQLYDAAQVAALNRAGIWLADRLGKQERSSGKPVFFGNGNPLPRRNSIPIIPQCSMIYPAG